MAKRRVSAVSLVALATALSLLGDSALYALLPIFYDDLGLLPIQVGILLSANRWVRLVTNHLAERMLYRVSPIAALTIALAAGALTTLSYAVLQTFFPLLLARIAWGLCWSFIRHVGVMTVATGTPAARLGQTMGLYNGIARTGSIVGIVAGGILFDAIGYGTTFLCFGVASLLAMPLSWFSSVPTDATAAAAGDDEPQTKLTALLVCGFALNCAGPGLIMSSFGFILVSRYGDETALFGWIVGIATLNGFILGSRWVLDSLGAPLLGALLDRIGMARGAAAFFVAGTFALVWLLLTEDLGALLIGILAFFVCGTSLQTAMASEASRSGPRQYARYATASDIGAATGPLLGWTAMDILGGYSVIFLLCAILYLAGALAAATLTRAARPPS